MSLIDLLKSTNIGPGGLLKFYIALKSDVLAIPAATGNSISTAITCKTGKKFAEYYFTPDTGKLTTNVVGETDGKSWESITSILFPGLSEEQYVELDKIINQESIVIIETNNGKYRVIGDLNRGALLDKVEGTSGGTMAERSQMTVDLKYNSASAPYFYTASVPLTPAA